MKSKFLVVLGKDAEGKPHAARFDIVDEAGVRKAAGLMGFRIAHAKTHDANELAVKLTEGRLFATGRGLVPYVREDIYEKLTEKLELEPANGVALPAVSPLPASADPWDAIKVGSIVLCKDGTAEPSWWEASVSKVTKDGKTLTVRWLKYPTLKPFSVKRHAVALFRQAT